MPPFASLVPLHTSPVSVGSLLAKRVLQDRMATRLDGASASIATPVTSPFNLPPRTVPPAPLANTQQHQLWHNARLVMLVDIPTSPQPLVVCSASRVTTARTPVRLLAAPAQLASLQLSIRPTQTVSNVQMVKLLLTTEPLFALHVMPTLPQTYSVSLVHATLVITQ